MLQTLGQDIGWAICKEGRNAEIRERKCPKARLQQRERKAESEGGDKGQKGRRGAERQGV
jgi:hypothetical protein